MVETKLTHRGELWDAGLQKRTTMLIILFLAIIDKSTILCLDLLFAFSTLAKSDLVIIKKRKDEGKASETVSWHSEGEGWGRRCTSWFGW